MTAPDGVRTVGFEEDANGLYASDDVEARPITIVGAGTLGRRVAAIYAAGGSEVRIVDPAEGQRAAPAPPDLNAVELMSDGRTDPATIDALMSRRPLYGFVPFHVRRKSDGFYEAD